MAVEVAIELERIGLRVVAKPTELAYSRFSKTSSTALKLTYSHDVILDLLDDKYLMY